VSRTGQETKVSNHRETDRRRCFVWSSCKCAAFVWRECDLQRWKSEINAKHTSLQNGDEQCELSSVSRARVEGVSGEAKRKHSYVHSKAGRHKLLYAREGKKKRAGVRNVLPATDPHGVVGRRSPRKQLSKGVQGDMHDVGLMA
jgi:hypothetical protein